MAASAFLGVRILNMPSERVFGAEGEPTTAEAMIGFQGKGMDATLESGLKRGR